MYIIEGRLTGDAPFLFNKMVDPSVLDSGVSGGGGSQASRLAEAELKVYRGTDGKLCVPKWTLKRVMLDGARESKLKVQKTSLFKLVNAFVFLDTDPTFGVADRSYIHEAVGRIPPGPRGKAAIIRRPALDTGWTLWFRLSITNEAIPSDQLKAVLVLAGSLLGMGSWRPEYGRFVVSEWQPSETSPAVAVPVRKRSRV